MAYTVLLYPGLQHVGKEENPVNPIPQISESELQLMKIIWEQQGSALYADIMEHLASKGLYWKKNTVLTFLSRLVDKQMLMAAKTGRRNLYKALVTEAEYQAAQTRCFVDKIYNGNITGLVSMLVHGDLVEEKDIEALRAFWEGKQDDG